MCNVSTVQLLWFVWENVACLKTDCRGWQALKMDPVLFDHYIPEQTAACLLYFSEFICSPFSEHLSITMCQGLC